MTNHKSLADLIREADAACPCSADAEDACPCPTGWCECSTLGNGPCLWPGHAAIRAVVRKCAEVAHYPFEPAATVDVYRMGEEDASTKIEFAILSAMREVDGE